MYQQQPPQQTAVYYTLVEGPLPQQQLSSESQIYLLKSRRSLSCGMFCLFIAFISLSVAAFAPLWVVASLQGSGSIFMVQYSVDFDVGSGFWMKNVCFGGSVPDEEVLQKFGITCEGKNALAGCEFDTNGKDINGNEECNRLRAAEGLSMFSLGCAIFGLAAGCCATTGSTLRVAFASLFSILSSFSAFFVLQIMKQSNMMDKEFGCSSALGAELCYRTGPSQFLQSLGVSLGFLAVVLFTLSGFGARRARMLYGSNEQQRYAVPSGVVVV